MNSKLLQLPTKAFSKEALSRRSSTKSTLVPGESSTKFLPTRLFFYGLVGTLVAILTGSFLGLEFLNVASFANCDSRHMSNLKMSDICKQVRSASSSISSLTINHFDDSEKANWEPLDFDNAFGDGKKLGFAELMDWKSEEVTGLLEHHSYYFGSTTTAIYWCDRGFCDAAKYMQFKRHENPVHVAIDGFVERHLTGPRVGTASDGQCTLAKWMAKIPYLGERVLVPGLNFLLLPTDFAVTFGYNNTPTAETLRDWMWRWGKRKAKRFSRGLLKAERGGSSGLSASDNTINGAGSATLDEAEEDADLENDMLSEKEPKFHKNWVGLMGEFWSAAITSSVLYVAMVFWHKNRGRREEVEFVDRVTGLKRKKMMMVYDPLVSKGGVGEWLVNQLLKGWNLFLSVFSAIGAYFDHIRILIFV